jgi:hypothetical protein
VILRTVTYPAFLSVSICPSLRPSGLIAVAALTEP